MTSPVVLSTNCQRTYGKLSLLTRKREPHGRILRLLRAMNGYAGRSPFKNQKPEGSTWKGCARNSKSACADLAVGMAVFTARIRQSALRYKKEYSINKLKSHHK